MVEAMDPPLPAALKNALLENKTITCYKITRRLMSCEREGIWYGRVCDNSIHLLVGTHSKYGSTSSVGGEAMNASIMAAL